MEIQCFTVGRFQVNTYLIKDEKTGISAIIDTGETDELVERLKALRPIPNIQMILLTHGHMDHAGSLPLLQQQFPKAITYLPRLEQLLFNALPIQGDWFGMPEMNRSCGRIDRFVDDGDEIMLGATSLHFLSTPGHTPGQGCYYDDNVVFVGDTLFAGSVGRTDFPMSDPAEMQRSLTKLLALPEQLQVYSGHGNVTTLAEEYAENPFLRFLHQ